METVVVIALRTDQPNIARRLKLILAAAEPIDSAPMAEVRAFELGHTRPNAFAMTATDLERLRDLLGEEATDRLGLSAVSEAPDRATA